MSEYWLLPLTIPEFIRIIMCIDNLLQQCNNIADTLIVGQFLGKTALADMTGTSTTYSEKTSCFPGKARQKHRIQEVSSP